MIAPAWGRGLSSCPHAEQHHPFIHINPVLSGSTNSASIERVHQEDHHDLLTLSRTDGRGRCAAGTVSVYGTMRIDAVKSTQKPAES
jgi:hypothetical protein